MKVTALIDEKLIAEVKSLSQGKTITEALVIALRDWVSIKRLRALSKELKEKPIELSSGHISKRLRALSRRRA